MSSLKQRSSAKTINRNTWADYPALRWRSKFYERTQFQFTFTDGEVIRLTHQSDKRKPFNWGQAYRIAKAFWALRLSGRWANTQGLSGEDRIRQCEEWERTHKAPKMVARQAAQG